MNNIGNRIIEKPSNLIDKTVWLKDVVGSYILIRILEVYDLNIGFPTVEISGEVLLDAPDSGYAAGDVDEWMLQVCELYEYKELN